MFTKLLVSSIVLKFFFDWLALLQGHCTCAQMHLLSVYMEPILHVSCPHNCEDFLSWLPPGLAFHILSYLDPGMI